MTSRELIDVMRQTAADAGRDAAAIEVTAMHPGLSGDDPHAALDELASWGVHRALIYAYRVGRGDVAEGCREWAEKLGIAP